jgi:hypothetical protein
MEALILNKKKPYMQNIDRRTEAVIFGFRPTTVEVMEICQKGKNIRTVYIAPSYAKTVAKSARVALGMLRVEVKPTPKKVWGIRTDLVGSWVNMDEPVDEETEEET